MTPDAVRHYRAIASLHIRVGSARCSSDKDGHMPEPQLVGRAMVRYPRFFYINPPTPGCQLEQKQTIITMNELSRIGEVHAAVQNYLDKGDFSVPFVICATETVDKDDVIQYVIDNIMNTQRVGFYNAVKSLRELGADVKNASAKGCKYYVKKVFGHEKLEDADFEALTQTIDGNSIPAFVIVCAGNTAKHAGRMPETAYIY